MFQPGKRPPNRNRNRSPGRSSSHFIANTDTHSRRTPTRAAMAPPPSNSPRRARPTAARWMSTTDKRLSSSSARTTPTGASRPTPSIYTVSSSRRPRRSWKSGSSTLSRMGRTIFMCKWQSTNLGEFNALDQTRLISFRAIVSSARETTPRTTSRKSSRASSRFAVSWGCSMPPRKMPVAFMST
jgi:hypothetical protein